MNWDEPLDPAFWLRVLVAILCGGGIGLERQVRGKPAGIRTSILVCLGTMLFVHLGIEFDQASADPTRVLGQVVSGIGFLGAGVILTRDGLIHGVTSAAVIWILAGIGSAIALHRMGTALAITGVTVGVLTIVQRLERLLPSVLRRGVHSPDAVVPEAEHPGRPSRWG